MAGGAGSLVAVRLTIADTVSIYLSACLSVGGSVFAVIGHHAILPHSVTAFCRSVDQVNGAD